VIEHGRTGLLAPGGDERALAALTRELLVDPGRRARLGEAAAAFVANERSVEATVDRLRDALARIPAQAASREGAA
jgi:glycosyltransferase involved in cell wall biosynthesis